MAVSAVTRALSSAWPENPRALVCILQSSPQARLEELLQRPVPFSQTVLGKESLKAMASKLETLYDIEPRESEAPFSKRTLRCNGYTLHTMQWIHLTHLAAATMSPIRTNRVNALCTSSHVRKSKKTSHLL